MNSAFELLQFLGRSANRVTVLEALTSRALTTRSELQRETGLPRSTVSRILSELGDRELVARVGHRYEVTPLGEFLGGRLQSVFDSIEAIQRLQTLLKQLSDTDPDIAFTDHARSEIVMPSSTDPGAPTRRFADLLHAALRVRLLTPVAIPVLFDADAVIGEGNRTFEVVVPRVAFEGERDDAMSQQFRGMIMCGDITLLSYDGNIPHFAGTIDGTAVVGLTDDEGAIQGYIETTDVGVRTWALALFSDYQTDTRPVAPTDLKP